MKYFIEKKLFSSGNTKLGYIPNWSIHRESCKNCRSTYCNKKCYGNKGSMKYSIVQKAYMKRYELVKEFPNIFKELARAELQFLGGFFRIHVAGDFFDQSYLNTWFDLANSFKNIQFMCYTKAFHLNFLEKPDNMTVLFSADVSNIDQCIKEYKNNQYLVNGISYIDDRNEKTNHACKIKIGKIQAMKKPFHCPGNCSKCLYCYSRNYNLNVYIKKH